MEAREATPGSGPAPAVSVSGVSKRYPLFGRRRDRALALIGRTGSLAYKTALEGVSLEVGRGEAVGIIGENGSGKSTLLRLVAGISEPDAGTIVTDRPVSAILELGLGFHPEFSGRENALLYGALIGVPQQAMRERLDAILEFAELGAFIDQPLRTYSSGMSARLGFAVATNVDPRVLVVDEALAVGDGAFQKKCVDRMVRFKQEGRAVLFCSHAMYLVAGFCERAVWLRDGAVAAAGPAGEVIHAYEDHLRHKGKRRQEQDGAPAPEAARSAVLGGVEVTPSGRAVRPGEALEVRVGVRRRQAGVPLHLAVAFEDENGVCVAAFATQWEGHDPLAGKEDETVALRLPQCPFARGRLDVTAYLTDGTGLQILDQLLAPGAVVVEAAQWAPGLVDVEHRWEVPSWT